VSKVFEAVVTKIYEKRVVPTVTRPLSIQLGGEEKLRKRRRECCQR
jgi:hypothetical protein